MTVFCLQQAEVDVPAENDWLCGNEALRLGGIRFPKRRADWRLGRWTAKCACAAYLGCSLQSRRLSEIEVRPAPSGAPEVFIAGRPAPVTISLTHRAGTAMVAVSAPGIALGCDLEAIEPRSDAFIADYFVSEEQALLTQAASAERSTLAAMLWSAKESALKALHEGLRRDTRSVLVSVADNPRISGDIAQNCAAKSAPSWQHAASNRRENDWRPLRIGCINCLPALHGWWQWTGNLVRTVVADQPLPPPVWLKYML